MDADDIIAALTATAEQIPPLIAETEVPRGKPGLYSIYIDDPKNLPGTFGRRLAANGTNLVYIGRAAGSLHERLVRQELRHRKPSTFFRSLGAVLGHRPVPASLEGKETANYKFSRADTETIIKWIDRHLTVGVVIHTGSSLEDDEKAIIGRLTPLLNIDDNPGALAELKELRKVCLRIARGE